MIGLSLRLASAVIISLAGMLVPTSVAAQDEPPLELVLTSITPQIPAPGDTVQITGYVQAAEGGDLGNVSVTVRITAQPFIGREQLDGYAAGRSNRSHEQVDGARAEIDEVGPGELAPFRLQAPISAFRLNSRGVYGVEVTARADGEISTVHTFLTWMPETDPVAPIQAAWLLPLVDRPVRDQAGAFIDDHLARSLAPDGRLGGLVQAARGRPVTWVMDPDVLVTAEAMAAGYRMTNGSDGKGARTAADWLAQLKRAVPAGRQVLTLPYADADLAALIRDERPLDVVRASQLGGEEASRILGVQPTTDIAWPVAGFADRQLIATLPAVGFRGVILDDAAVPVAANADLTYTPTGRADLGTDGGTIGAALADDSLAAILHQDTRRPGVGTLVIQRMLAETAWIALEQPNRQRAILIEPPRRWNPDPAVAAQLLAGFSEAPWIKPIGITDLLSIQPPDFPPRADPIFPGRARAAELPMSHISAVAQLGNRVNEFATILTDPSHLAAAYSSALSKAESSAWADGNGEVTDAGKSYLSLLRDDLNNQVDKIRIISHGTVTLSSNKGTVPVTIANDLDQPVQVRLSLTPRVASRLTVDEPQPVIIDPAARQTIEVGASAVASGITTIDAQLLTIAGDQIGSPTQFNVRATNFGLVGFIVIGGAMVLLVLSAAVRIIRRTVKKKQRRAVRAAAPTERVKA